MLDQATILAGCKQNDRVSQQKLYMDVYSMLYALCRRFFDDEHDIVTALNNGMLRVFKNIDQYDALKASLHTWIYAIVRNEALTHVRNKRTAMPMHELTNDLASELMNDPFAKTQQDEVSDYLDRLSGSTRTVCSLFYAEGFSIKEIADVLSMKDGTVKWHLHEGRKQLQQLLKKNDNGVRIANAG